MTNKRIEQIENLTDKRVMGGCVYIMASGPFGTLYTGVTANLTKRVWQHQESENDGSAFCKKYGVNRLVYYEQFECIENAIHREKRIKKWPRRWKTRLIEQFNPEWRDLYETLF